MFLCGLTFRTYAASAGAIAIAFTVLSAPQIATAAGSDIYMYQGPDRAARILAGAKKEGKVVVYAGLLAAAFRTVADGFYKKYPGIKIDYTRGNSRKTLPLVRAERQTKNIIADIIESSGIAKEAILAGVVQPFISPSTKNFNPAYIGAGNMYAADRVSYFGLAYNTTKVSANDVPKTYDDYLKPKLKGKLSWRAQLDSGAELFIAHMVRMRGKKNADAYFKKLSKQNVTNFNSSARALVDRVGQGEYPIAMNIFAHHPLIIKAKGAPIEIQMLDPIPSTMGTILAIKDAPHPHAAMLFIDYILSKDGQTKMRQANYFPSNSDVAPKATLNRILPKNAKMKEFIYTPEMVADYRKPSNAIWEKYFK